ncbi:MAG: hypothetical protein JWR30_2771 [Conexibacter sp.]|nr:hypothetical protein [Conexibacter sp.]
MRMRLLRSASLITALPLALVAAGGPLASAADESAKSPRQILADLSRDLGKVRNYHFSGSQTDPDGRSSLAGDATASGRANLVIRKGASAVRLIAVPAGVYVKGNAAYWKSVGGSNGASIAKQLADRWVKAPGSQDKSLVAMFQDLTPKHLASCTAVGTGTLAKGGTATIAGRKAVVIVDRGDKPGTTPGRLYVTASGPVLPLRVTQTGRRRAGGRLDPRCQEKDDKSTASDLTFSRFDAPLKIAAPHGAITLPSGGGGTGTPA